MENLKLGLFASGSGSDANAIMTAWRADQLPGISEIVLLSTKQGAGCLEKAEKNKVRSEVIDRTAMSQLEFEEKVINFLVKEKVDLVYLVGCVCHIPQVPGVLIRNIHPAAIPQFGGIGMFGLEPHKRVLAYIIDQIKRGHKSEKDAFYTYPTIHAVEEVYDSGVAVLKGSVRVPAWIIEALLSGQMVLEEAAKKLQKAVLVAEHLMLPAAVNLDVAALMAEAHNQEMLEKVRSGQFKDVGD